MRKMHSAEAFGALPRVPGCFGFDYRWMAYPGTVYPPFKHPHDASVATFRGHRVLGTLVRVYFSPAATTGQRYVYSGSADGCVYIYDVLTGEIHAVLRAHRGIVRDVAWHPTSPYLASGSWDGSVCLWGYDESAASRQSRAKAARHRMQALVRDARRPGLVTSSAVLRVAAGMDGGGDDDDLLSVGDSEDGVDGAYEQLYDDDDEGEVDGGDEDEEDEDEEDEDEEDEDGEEDEEGEEDETDHEAQ
jgi:hypothetical protein